MAPHRTYNVELGPRGWAQIGTVNRDEFDRVRAELAALAARAAEESGSGVESRTLRIGSLVLVCSIDRARQVIVVDAIVRELEPPHPGDPARTSR